MAELVGDAYIRITADTDVMRRALAKQMKSAGKDDAGNYVRSFSNEVDSIASERMRGANRALAKALGDPKEFDRMAKSFDSIEHAADKWRKTLLSLSRQHKIATGDYKIFKDAINDWEKAAIDARKASDDLSVAEFRAARASEANARRWRAVRLLRDDDNRSIRRSMSHYDRWGGALDKFGGRVGKLFGKGARNNFVNLVGVMVGGLASLAAGVVSIPLKMAANFTDAFQAAGKEGAKFTTKLGAGFAGMFADLVSLGPVGILVAIAGAIAAVVAAATLLPAVVATVSLLAGAISALAGSITFGLIGALLAVAPLLAGIAGGFVAVGAAFLSFFGDKKKKQMVKDFIQPFKDFGKQFHGQVEDFLGGFKGGLKTVLDDLTPSVNAFFASWKENMNDPQTKKGLGQLSDGIGKIATTFNSALPRLFSGLIGFFRPIVPFAQKLADAIGKAFGSFDDWANSKEGQQSISTFMYKAWDSAKKVWGILKEIGKIIWSVFEGGQDTGDSLLDSMLAKLTEIREFLQSPEGKQKMKDWFADAKGIAEDLGKVASAVGEIIVAFNSPGARDNAKALMDAIVGMANIASKIFGLANDIDRITKAVFNSRSKPKPQSVPSLNETKEQTKARVEKSLVNREVEISMDVNDKFAKEKIQAIENYVSTGVTIPIKGNEALWEASKGKAEQWVFTAKQIPIDGNTEAWDRDKGTIDAFVFKTKPVPVVIDDSDVQAWAAAWNKKTFQTKTARVVVSTVSGQGQPLGGGIPKNAAGGFYNQPTVGMFGEAGPEAIVPLDRDLSQVDPAVRQMSAVLQSMTGGRGGNNAATLGPKVNFSEGAISVNLPTGDPRLAAEAVLDRLVAYIR